MTPEQLYEAVCGTKGRYNLHSHTHYCDGHAPLEEMVTAAADSGMLIWGVSPHCPIVIESPCNMKKSDVATYIEETASLADRFHDIMQVLTSMEVDFLSRDFGPHIDYFHKLPLHYRIGSVHFVPNQEKIPFDCDGSAERFSRYLHDYYSDDLRYVVERYFEQVLLMLELGGFEVLGHFDKIAGNASAIDPEIENQHWYEALIDDVISHAASSDVLVEINTKAITDRKRFYPAERWWGKIKEASLPIVVNSDAHWPDKVNEGRQEALDLLSGL